ncbi:hypothetical protein J6590_066518 [Homalodisca vitripennis]|nr:hypothetical protein J6590_066518 [Homalodisca vitripennis]
MPPLSPWMQNEIPNLAIGFSTSKSNYVYATEVLTLKNFDLNPMVQYRKHDMGPSTYNMAWSLARDDWCSAGRPRQWYSTDNMAWGLARNDWCSERLSASVVQYRQHGMGPSKGRLVHTDNMAWSLARDDWCSERLSASVVQYRQHGMEPSKARLWYSTSNVAWGLARDDWCNTGRSASVVQYKQHGMGPSKGRLVQCGTFHVSGRQRFVWVRRGALFTVDPVLCTVDNVIVSLINREAPLIVKLMSECQLMLLFDMECPRHPTYRHAPNQLGILRSIELPLTVEEVPSNTHRCLTHNLTPRQVKLAIIQRRMAHCGKWFDVSTSS